MNKLIKLGLCILFLLVGFVSSETIDITDFDYAGQDYIWNDNLAKNESNEVTTLTDGLVAYWKLNGNAIDEMGSYNGTYSGLSNSTGHLGDVDSALEFGGAGSGNTISIAPISVETIPWSVSAWVKSDMSNTEHNSLFNLYFYLNKVNNKVFYMDDTGATSFSAVACPDNEWCHVLVSCDNSSNQITYYINGVYSDTDSISCHKKEGYFNRIGGYNANLYVMKGSMDNVRIYNRTLSFEEVKALYEERNDNHENGSLSYAFCIDDCINETGLVGQWKLNGDGVDALGLTNLTMFGNPQNSTECRYGSCFSFDGVGDYFLGDHTYGDALHDEWAISVWINNFADSDSFGIIHFSNSTSKISGIGTYFGKMYYYSKGCLHRRGTIVFNDSQLHHIYADYDGVDSRVFIDGVEDILSSQSGASCGAQISKFSIGTDLYNRASEFPGIIDNVMLWNRSLSVDEIYKLYLSGYERVPNAKLKSINYDGDVDASCNLFNSSDAPFNETYSTNTFDYSNWTGYYSNDTSISFTSYSSGETIGSKADYGVCEFSGIYFNYANLTFEIEKYNLTTIIITDNYGNTFNTTDNNGNELVNGYEDQDITVSDSTGKKLVEVEGLFSGGEVDLSNVNIEYNDRTVVVDFSSVSNVGSTHSLYYPAGSGFLLCPEAKTLSAARSGCANETLFTHTDALNNVSKSIADVYDVSVTIDGSYYKVSGLIGTAITWAQNKSIVSRVSISNTPPTVDSVILSDSDGGDMDLYPNSTITINCSGTASDTDGWSTISINATINTTVSAGSSDNLLNHYSNSSCTTSQNTATQANYECTFLVWYNAIPGTWTCTATATDGILTDSDIDVETMGQLMAIDIDEGDLDFGALAVGASTTDSSLDHSNNKTIYNQGNVIFDVNLKAYGDSGIGDNNSMSCDSGNITISMLKYTFNTTSEAHNWSLMTSMQNGSGTDYNISVPVSQDTSGTPTNPSNSSWWAYKIPTEPIVSGDCSGTLIFSAVSNT